MSNNKQSSVEYLMDKLFDPSSMVEEQLEWFEQAKAMHKKEFTKAFTNGYRHSIKPLNHDIIDKDYNETFGNEQTN